MGWFLGKLKEFKRMNLVSVAPKGLQDALGPTTTEGSIKDCSSPIPVKPPVKLYGMTFSSFRTILLGFIGFIALAGLTLIFELRQENLD